MIHKGQIEVKLTRNDHDLAYINIRSDEGQADQLYLPVKTNHD